MSGRPILLILLDGVADRTCSELGDLTPLEAAATPNLDRIAAGGVSGFVYPIEPGLVPPSELPHFHLFGYAPYPFPGRAVLEALGHGVGVPMDAVVTHAGLRHVTPTAAGFEIAHWWPRDEDDDCAALVASVSSFESDGVTVSLRFLGRSDSLLTLHGGSEDVTDSDPFFFTRLPAIRVEPLAGARDPGAASRTARALNRYLLWTRDVLEGHPVNAGRRARGAHPMNMLLTKWTGRRRPLPPFVRRAGVEGTIIASTPIYAGFAALLGMRYVDVPEYVDDPEKEVAEKLRAAREALEAGAGFVHLHTKAADEAAHAHSPVTKRNVIEAIDRGLAELAAPWAQDVVVAVTADHATPSQGPMLHTGDSVPLAVSAPTVRRDAVTTFGERPAVAGGLGQLRARDVLPILLNAADRARFLGSRPTPDAGLGVPRVTPLRPEDVE
ncbi:MAG: 2,3-bisphosphoglycerate-independent phosphoglycerate mutase [Candidatus Rokubacteria bacterium]|nr:2,3-bisphosphoglycerate-independent phosphoglycerate mutase [Candidatus Rokubacteria bacterium]